MQEIHIKEPVILAILTTLRYNFESCDTRSVYLFDNPHPRDLEGGGGGGKTKMVIIDNLEFNLFISIPLDMSINALIRFMISSYCNSKFGTLEEINRNNAEDDDDENEYDGTIPKGYYYNEKANESITSETCKETLKRIDKWNRQNYRHYFRKSYHRSEESNCHILDDPDDAIQLHNIMIIKKVESLTPFKPHMLPQENAFLVNEKQFKLTFNNHMILAYFLTRFKKAIQLFIPNSGGAKRYYDVKVMDFHRKNDIAESRIAPFQKPLRDITKDGITQYIENQLTILREDTRKEKAKGDGSFVKTGTLDVVKLRINMKHTSFRELDGYSGLLHPSYYPMAEYYDEKTNGGGSNDSGYIRRDQPKIHRAVMNDVANFPFSFFKSTLNEMVKYQTLFIELHRFTEQVHGEEMPPLYNVIYRTDMNTNVTVSIMKGLVIATSFQEQKKLKRKIEEQEVKKNSKRVKSNHYKVDKEESVTKMVSRRQKSITGFLKVTECTVNK
jgi:hypothetical protein